MTFEYEKLNVEQDGMVVVAAINHPPANSMGQGVLRDLEDLLAKCEKDDSVRAIIITGTGNKLFSAGAEAIAINDQRIVARTAIRCVGPNIMINGEPTAAEFVVRAIGSSHDLEGALNIPNGIIDVLRMGVKVKVEKSEKVQVPAFSGATHVKHARPAGPGKE